MINEWRFERLAEPALHGLSSGDTRRLAMHLHGSWGNFYENGIALDTREAYTRHAYGYASVNTGGHDGGTVNEDLHLGSADISRWMTHFENSGTQEWILQGHSLGALKIIRALHDRAVPQNVRGAVLMSPFDLPAFYAQSGEDSVIIDKRREAGRLAEATTWDSAVPAELFATWPVSLATFATALEPGGVLDVFQSRNHDLHHIRDLDIPVLVLLGGADFAATPDNHVETTFTADGAGTRLTVTVPIQPARPVTLAEPQGASLMQVA